MTMILIQTVLLLMSPKSPSSPVIVVMAVVVVLPVSGHKSHTEL
jgi:hypothetical protein